MKKTLIPVSISILLFCAATVSAQPPIPIPTPQPTPIRNVNNAPDLPRRDEEINERNILQQKGYIRVRDRDFRPLSPVDISKTARDKVKISKDEKAAYEKIARSQNAETLD